MVANPCIGILDIETSPAEALVWGLHDQNLGVSQIIKRRSVLSVAIYLPNEKKMLYFSTAGQKDLRNDKRLLLWTKKQLDKLDILITQNGKQFDIPILLGRMAVHGITPPNMKAIRHIDTCQIARGLGFMSSKLENLTVELCPDLAKSVHKDFPGFSLWTAFLAGNKKAQREMKHYNCQDVRGTYGVWQKLAPFATGRNDINFSSYVDNEHMVCSCGSTHFQKRGVARTDAAAYQIYHCRNKACGRYIRGRKNLLAKGKK